MTLSSSSSPCSSTGAPLDGSVVMECVPRDVGCALTAVGDWSNSSVVSSSSSSSSSVCPLLCRRAASFPIVNRGEPIGLLRRHRSQSESAGLNRLGNSCLLLSQRHDETPVNKVVNDVSEEEGSSEEDGAGLVAEELSSSPSNGSKSSPSNGSKFSPSNGSKSSPSNNSKSSPSNGSQPSPSSNSSNSSPSSNGSKFSPSGRSVRFADDCGCELYTIRVMTEPSDYPPRISPSVLRRLRGIGTDEEEESACASSWVLAFPQPASDYLKFRSTIESQIVGLENVMLKNETSRMQGTVKVKNIAFEKRVFVRMSTDLWVSYMDYAAVFQPSSSKVYDTFSFDIPLPLNDDTAARVEFCLSSSHFQVYDTFSFDIPLPMNDDTAARVEFCICFEIGDGEQQFWDSNDGRNYSLVGPESSEPLKMRPLFGRACAQQNSDDAYRLDYDNWTKFASWKNLSTERPYW